MTSNRCLLLLALSVIAGCGPKSDPGKPSASGTAPVSVASKPTVAFVTNNAGPFWVVAREGTKKAALDFNVDVDFQIPAQREDQRRIITDLLTRGIKGIAVSPVDAANMVDFCAKINQTLPLITQDSDLPDPSARRCYIGTNNYRAGRSAGELLVKAVPSGGKFAIFVGEMGAQNAVERRQGILDVLSGIDRKDFKDLTDPTARDLTVGKFVLVETKTDGGSNEECQKHATDILTRNPDMAAVVGLWEYNPPALLRAVANTKHKAIVIGFDVNEDTLNGIIGGQAFGTIAQDPYQFGYQSVKILAGLANGDNGILKAEPGIDSDNRIFIEHHVITKDNVKAFWDDLKSKLQAQ